MQPTAGATATASAAEERPSFAAAVRRRVRLRDLLFLLTVPVVLGAVFRLPEAVRREFAFYYLDPSPVTAFTAHFVHLSGTHLVANVAGFLMLAPTAYLLFCLAGHRRFFLAAFTTTVLAFPIPLSYLNLVAPRNAIGFGFSGIMTAQLGLIPIGLVLFARERFDYDWRPRTAIGPFVCSLIVIGALVVPVTWRSVAMATGAVAGGTVHVTEEWRDRSGRTPLGGVVKILTTPGDGELFLVGSVLWIGVPLLAFGPSLTVDGAPVSHFAHLMGYTLSFLVASIAAELW